MKKNFIVPNPEQIEYVIGIDFGHGETSAAICRIDDENDPEDIDITGTGQKAIPSVMNIDSNGSTYIGKGAVNRCSNIDDFYAYFKESPDTLDEQLKPSIRIMKLYMKQVYDTICNRYAGVLMEGNEVKKNHVVFIACPSKSQKWDDQAMQNYVQMALDAGLPIAGATIDDKFQLSGIVRESRAAYIRMMQKGDVEQFAKEGILVVDYGSSTIDITYYKDDETPVDKGYELGAQKVEKSIYNYLKTWHKDLGKDQAPDILETIEQNNVMQYTKLLFGIRISKEHFYTDIQDDCAQDMEISYRFPSPVAQSRLSVYITKEVINQILEDYIDQVKNAFVDFKNTIIGDKPITLLVLTGGASKMNFVTPLAQSVFGTQAKLLPPQDTSLTVSNGIATAARADIKLYYLAEELYNNSKITTPDVLTLIYQDTAEKIADNIIREVLNCYENFKDQTVSESIVALREKISSKLLQQSNSYKDIIQSAFNNNMKLYTNDTVKKELEKYVTKHFPYYNLSKIERIEIRETNVNLTPNDMDTLNNVVADSIKQIEDSALVEAIKLIYDIAAIVAAGGIKVLTEVIVGGVNLGKYVWKWLNDEKFSEKDKEKAPTYEEILDALFIEFNDEDKKLDTGQRKKVYKAFNDNKSTYKNSLINDIKEKLKNNKIIKDNILLTGKQLISQYIIDEISRIQLQIK